MRQYILKVTQDEDALSVDASNSGFSPLELLGIYTLKIEDIKQQMKGEIKPDVIKRTVIKEEENERD